jgi:hypothetical protein
VLNISEGADAACHDNASGADAFRLSNATGVDVLSDPENHFQMLCLEECLESRKDARIMLYATSRILFCKD